MIRSKQRKSLGIRLNSKASGGGCEIRTHAPVKANGFQDRLVMTTSITLRVFNFIKNRNPSQGKLRENCEKRFSQSASDDAKNPIKSRVFKKLHKQTKEVFKTARQNHLWVRIKVPKIAPTCHGDRCLDKPEKLWYNHAPNINGYTFPF